MHKHLRRFYHGNDGSSKAKLFSTGGTRRFAAVCYACKYVPVEVSQAEPPDWRLIMCGTKNGGDGKRYFANVFLIPAISARHFPRHFRQNPRHSRFPRHSRAGGNQLAAGRRMLRRKPRYRRGFYIPVILATAGIHPFAIFSICAKAQRRFIAENGKPLRRRKPPVINGRQSRPAHSRIFPSCFARWFALRANGKNAAIIACAIMPAPKARLDSRSRENDGDIKSPSSQMALCAISIRRLAAS